MQEVIDLFEKEFKKKLDDIKLLSYKRYLFDDLINQSKYVDTITFIKGIRGVGKTTICLQLAQTLLEQNNKVIYFSADHIIFAQHNLYDFVSYLYEHEYKYVFIDEIHLYENCAQELKNMVDNFKIKIFVTGSNGLKIQKTKYDLSRRAVVKELTPLSYREFIALKETKEFKSTHLNEVLADYKKLTFEYKYAPLDLYWSKGALPFFLKYDDTQYFEIVKSILDKLIYEDLMTYNINKDTIWKAKNILLYLAQNPPSEINPNSIAGVVGLSRDTVINVLEAFKDIGVIREIASTKQGKNTLKNNKKYLLVPPFRSILCKLSLTKPNLGALREDFFINHVYQLQPKYFKTIKSPDYVIANNIFEIGGKTKSKRQIAGIKKSYLVKDTSFSQDSIPLYLFGYLY